MTPTVSPCDVTGVVYHPTRIALPSFAARLHFSNCPITDYNFHGAQCLCTHTFHSPPLHAHISLFHGAYCTTYSLRITVDTATYSYGIPLPCSQDLHHPHLDHNCASPTALSLSMPRPHLLVRHLLLGPVSPRPAPLTALPPNCLHALLMPTHRPIPWPHCFKDLHLLMCALQVAKAVILCMVGMAMNATSTVPSVDAHTYFTRPLCTHTFHTLYDAYCTIYSLLIIANNATYSYGIPLAQLVRRQTSQPEVRGSIPAEGSNLCDGTVLNRMATAL